jgi:hypothetical protein
MHPARILLLRLRKTPDLDRARHLIGDGQENALVVFEILCALKTILGDNDPTDGLILYPKWNPKKTDRE